MPSPPPRAAALVGGGHADNWQRTEGFGCDPEGYRLVTVGADAHHTVAVWRSFRGTWTDAVLEGHAASTDKRVRGRALCGGWGGVWLV